MKMFVLKEIDGNLYWCGGAKGYTKNISKAARYTGNEAREHCRLFSGLVMEMFVTKSHIESDCRRGGHSKDEIL